MPGANLYCRGDEPVRTGLGVVLPVTGRTGAEVTP